MDMGRNYGETDPIIEKSQFLQSLLDSIINRITANRMKGRQTFIPEYVDLIKAVMMQESSGSGNDPMQCSESPYNKKYPKKPGGIKDPEYSIECGVHYLAYCLKSADCEGPLDMDRIRLAIQGYNYGNGYISWAIKRDGGYTVQNAAVFSRQQAKKHGWKSYGDKLYAAHVLRYYPYGNYNYCIGNAEIIKVAASQLGNKGGRKFWTWYGLKSRVAWCTIFVSWCADQCGYVQTQDPRCKQQSDYGLRSAEVLKQKKTGIAACIPIVV